jgi:energy-coupling factor transport system permease protein
VNFAPRYLGRGSWLARRDPRVLILVVVLFVTTVVQVWDLRLMVALFALAFVYYRSARIPFHAVRFQWTFAIAFVSLVVVSNLVFASGRVQRLPADAVQHVYGYLPVLGTPISAESVTFAITQWARFIAMIAVGLPLAFALDPEVLGVTFARLGVNYRFAFAIDLTWRFVPSFLADFRNTVDAQRVRGLELSSGRVRGPIAKVRRQVPVLVPTVVNAIAGAEDTIDAMDLRAFGTGKRTWFRELRFDPTDRLVLGGFFALLVAATIAAWTAGTALLWVPPILIPGG